MANGRPPDVSDEELLRYVVYADGPAVGTSEVVEEFDYGSLSAARDRLDALVDSGKLDSKSVGPARIYWLTEDGTQLLADDVDE